MSLEATLAEIQVRAKEISNRSIEGHRQGLDVDWSGVNHYSDGIVHEAVIAYDSYKAASRRSNDSSSVNRHLGEFATGLKNLADNLNGLLQTIYNPSDKQVSHKDIEQIRARVPKLEDGTNLLDLFLQTHACDGEVVKLRNRRSHGFGHDLVSVDRYGLTLAAGNGSKPVQSWMDEKVQQYLEMVKSVLNCVAEKETLRLADREEYSGPSVIKQRWKNWNTRHRKPLAMAAGIALGAFGASAAMFLQELKEKEKDAYPGSKVSALVNFAYWSEHENWALGLLETKSGELINEVYTRTANLGVRCDDYIITLNAWSNGKISGNLKDDYDSFARQRKSFYISLINTKNKLKQGTYLNRTELIHDLSGILYTERDLTRIEEKLNKRLGFSAPRARYSSIIPEKTDALLLEDRN